MLNVVGRVKVLKEVVADHPALSAEHVNTVGIAGAATVILGWRTGCVFHDGVFDDSIVHADTV